MKLIILFGMCVLLAFELQAQDYTRISELHFNLSNSPIELEKGQRQLFIDDYLIERIDGLRRVVNQPKKHPENPLIRPDMPWESRAQAFGAALFDDERGIFRFWYLIRPKDRGSNPLIVNNRERAPNTCLLAYAESNDGIQWNKPNLGQFPYDGDRNNNLIDLGLWNCEGISVLYDKHEIDLNRRWKAVYWDHGSGGGAIIDGCQQWNLGGLDDGFCVAFSPDGINWTPYEGNPVLFRYCDCNQNVVYDEKIGKYVAFSRFGFGRRLGRSESVDFIHWTIPQLVLDCDKADGRGTQIYSAGIDIYEGLYIAPFQIYREYIDGKIDVQLAVSRDGIHWTRVGERATWLPLGDDDSWEGGWVGTCERFIIHNDEIYIYYLGRDKPHQGPKFGRPVRKYPISTGLAILRRDGFVSLDAEEKEGYILTKPFILFGSELLLNVDATNGEINVDVTDVDGNLIKGFNHSQPITGNRLSAIVKWKNASLSDIAGQLIRLRINMRSAKLYSFWFK